MDKQVISSTKLARELLKKGFIIVDIAPHKKDNRRTVFVFEKTKEFIKYMNRR